MKPKYAFLSQGEEEQFLEDNVLPDTDTDVLQELTDIQQQRPYQWSISIFLADLLGTDVLTSLHTDAKLLILCKTVRMFGFGFLSVMVRFYRSYYYYSCYK